MQELTNGFLCMGEKAKQREVFGTFSLKKICHYFQGPCPGGKGTLEHPLRTPKASTQYEHNCQTI